MAGPVSLYMSCCSVFKVFVEESLIRILALGTHSVLGKLADLILSELLGRELSAAFGLCVEGLEPVPPAQVRCTEENWLHSLVRFDHFVGQQIPKWQCH